MCKEKCRRKHKPKPRGEIFCSGNARAFPMLTELSRAEVLEPQDPKPASRASSGRPTPQLALKFGSTLRAENFKPLGFALVQKEQKVYCFLLNEAKLRRFDKHGTNN